jgi:ABC-type branched-subunit amino acid transport system ATPase component
VADIEAHKYSLSDVESILRTNLSKGLTSADASARLLRDGPNMLTPPKQTPWWVKLLKQLVGGFQLMLVGAAILCWIVANLSDPVDSQTNFLGYVLVAVVVFTGVFAFFQEAKSDKVMEGFKALTPSRCHVIRDGAVIECAAGDLVIGDVVEVQFGEKVPADLRIIQTANLKVDNSSLTGEAEPLSRSVDCTHDNPMETKNIAFYGTFFTEGSGRGVVFQTFALFPWKTVGENVGFGPRMRGLPKKECDQIALEFLSLVGLEHVAQKYPNELSGGMQQRVGVVRALANNPDVLLMDEPFASVDAQTRMTLQEELTKIWQERRPTILFITHDVAESVFWQIALLSLAKAVFLKTCQSICNVPESGKT